MNLLEASGNEETRIQNKLLPRIQKRVFEGWGGGTLRHHKEHVDVAQECILNVIIAVAYETLDQKQAGNSEG